MGNFLQNLGEIWRRTGLVQRVLLTTVLLACAGAAALLVRWAREPEMALLYTDLEPQEAARIVEKVREAGLAYKVKDGGRTVLVPAEQVHTIRLDLAGEGLPAGDTRGYRILDEEKIGASPFSQQINYRRALEGELARTITLLEGVAGARVHIVRPESKLLRGTEGGASATVVLRLRQGWRLTPRNVAAIVHLVAGSIENLKPEDVVVVDGAGNLLSGAADQGFAKGASTLLDYKGQVEDYLARKAEDMLTLVLGPGRATVKVDAAIETSTVNQTVEKYDPENKVPTKEELKTKSSSGGPPAAEATAAPTTTKEETIVTDFLVSRTIEQTVNMPGKILKLSVAAFVDLSAPEPPPAAPGAEGAAPASPPAPKITVQEVEEVIRNAVGLKETDTLKVISTPFHRPPVPEAPPEQEDLFASPQFYLDLARHASLGVLVVGALLVLKIFGGAKRKLAATPGATALAAGQGAGAVNLLAGGSPGLLANPGEMRHRIAAALQENPEEVKRLFRTWVEGEEGGS